MDLVSSERLLSQGFDEGPPFDHPISSLIARTPRGPLIFFAGSREAQMASAKCSVLIGGTLSRVAIDTNAEGV